MGVKNYVERINIEDCVMNFFFLIYLPQIGDNIYRYKSDRSSNNDNDNNNDNNDGESSDNDQW